jgi:hypothetical protein
MNQHKGKLMPFSNATGRYYRADSGDFPRSLSRQQLLVLYVAANYNLRRSRMGWWADGHVFPDGVVKIHSPATIKSLLKLGFLEGNVGGEALGLGSLAGSKNLPYPCVDQCQREKATRQNS